MTCGHCLHAVNSALVSTPGVRLESLRMGRAAVSYDEQTTDPAAIERMIADAGYTATAARGRRWSRGGGVTTAKIVVTVLGFVAIAVGELLVLLQ